MSELLPMPRHTSRWSQQVQRPSASWKGRLTTCWSLLALCLCFYTLCPSEAHAQRGQIRLFTADTSFRPGQPITLYVYMFQVDTMTMRFGRMQLRPSRDYVGQARLTQLFNRELMLRGGGFFPKEVSYTLYRATIQPAANKQTVKFGPIYFRGLVSNVLTFQKVGGMSSSGGGKVSTQLTLPTGTQVVGKPFDLKAMVRCPLSVCRWSTNDLSSVVTILQNSAKIGSSADFLHARTKFTPQLELAPNANPPEVRIRLRYRLTPLKSGELTLPQIRVGLPSQLILPRIRQWVMQQNNWNMRQASQVVDIPRRRRTSSGSREAKVPTRSIVVQQGNGCPGEWDVQSRWVSRDGGVTRLWQLSLTGKGPVLLAQSYFRRAVTDFLAKHKLSDKLTLQDYAWELPDMGLNGGAKLHFLFKLKDKNLSLPSFQMKFADSNNKAYVRKTVALPAAQATNPAPLPTRFSKDSKRIFVYYDNAPTRQGYQNVDVWSYQLTDQFPVAEVLRGRWTLNGNLELQQQVKQKRFEQRSQFGGGFSVSTQIIPIRVSTGQIRAKLQVSALAKFPAVKWGRRWVTIHEETGKGVTFKASTNRSSYIEGEPIEYKVVFSGPSSDFPAKGGNFYEKQFLPLLKIPNLDKQQGLQILEKFKRREEGNNRVSFTYKVRFRSVKAGPFQLDSATMRFGQRKLQLLMRQHQLCVFRGARGGDQLLDAISSIHLNRRGGGSCNLSTQELTTSSITLTITPRPDQAQGVKLIGSFRLNTEVKQLMYPRKQTTLADKPFYVMVDVAGQGDLKAARALLKEQIDKIARQMERRGVAIEAEDVKDKTLSQRGIVRLQVQVIAERAMSLVFPSLSLRYYDRENGVVKAQTLPITLTIKQNRLKNIAPARRAPVAVRSKPTGPQQLLSETDLRPNLVLPSGTVVNQSFTLRSWERWGLLLVSPLLFLFFLGWHRRTTSLAQNPEKQRSQKALKQFRQGLGRLDTSVESWERQALQTLQLYLSERMQLNSKQITAHEAAAQLKRRLPQEAHHDNIESLKTKMDRLEGALYGGGAIADRKVFADDLQQLARSIDRALPQEGK